MKKIMKWKKNKRGFSLIELLVVITIMGILAGLSVQAVLGAMEKGRQMRDVHNMKQIGHLLITEAFERSFFRTQETLENTDLGGSTLDVVKGLLEDEVLSDPMVLMGEGAIAAQDYNIKEEHIGFQYVAGYGSSSPSRLPLLFTKGVVVTQDNMTGKVFDPGTSAWGTKGMAVCYVGGNAEWIKGKEENGQMELEKPLGIARNTATLNIEIYD